MTPISEDSFVAATAPYPRYVIIHAVSRLCKLSPETNSTSSKDHIAPQLKAGRLLALDLGTRRVGVAVSDELHLTVRPLPPLARTNWKDLVKAVGRLRERFDARAVVIGLPLRLDGTPGDAAHEARRLARNLSLSLGVPVFMQDERLTSQAAEDALRASKISGARLKSRIDSEAAAIFLRDFIMDIENK